MNTLFWSKIQRGDEGAFRQLYEQYADLLYGYGMKIAGDDDLVTEFLSDAHAVSSGQNPCRAFRRPV